MSGVPARNKGLKDRLVSEFRRQPKRAAVLGVLLLVLVALTAREVARRTGPASAGAAVTAPDAPSRAPRADGAQEDANGDRPRDALLLSNVVVNRDLFAPDPVYFPPDQRAKPAPVVTPVDDASAKAEAERRAVQAQAQALTLQSTVVGSLPTAIINGQILRIGDWISGFQVTEIHTRRCAVEKNGMRVVLEMAN